MFHKLFILSFIALIFSTQSSFSQMVLSSDSILEGKIIKESACRNKGGRDISPQLTLSGIPEGTKSISIIMDDPDAIKPAKKIWVHWNVFNISVSGGDYSLSAGEKPNGLIAKGHSGTGYKGMCPPDGKHTYRIAVYAQKDDVNATKSGKYTLEKFEKKFGDSIIEKIIITGDFK